MPNPGATPETLAGRGREVSATKRDRFWRGPPKAVSAWAALGRDGELMPNSVRARAEDIRLACGECVPVRVRIQWDADPSELFAELNTGTPTSHAKQRKPMEGCDG